MKNGVCTWVSFLCRKAIAEKKISPSLRHIFFPCHGRFLQKQMLRMSFWFNSPCTPARHGICEMFTSSPALPLLPSVLLQGKPGDNITHVPATPCRDQRGSGVQPPHAWLLPYPQPFVWAGATTRSWQGHPSPPAEGVTELSCPSRESICQEIMIMDHPIPTHSTSFPFHTLSSMMDSKRKTFSGAS